MEAIQDLTVRRQWLAPRHGWLARLDAALRARAVHPARAVVLLPYAQLVPVAARLWAQARPDGFAPRFETTQSWSRALAVAAPEAPDAGATDLAYEMALDLLSARELLEGAGLGAQAELLAARLVEAAQQLGPLAAAVPPRARAAWAARARGAVASGLEGEALRYEAALAQLAVAWAASSAYVTDALFEPAAQDAVDAVIVLPGVQPDPLLAALAEAWGERLCVLLLEDGALPAAPGVVQLHPARDAPDEAQRAAACVIRHVNAGRAPVALVAVDRALTRRVRAQLEGAGLALRDETGWKLSTSRAAAQLMGALRACARQASGDAVLDWLKNAPALDAVAVRALEARLRRQSLRVWGTGPQAPHDEPALAALLAQVRGWREDMQRARSLPQWLDALRDLLRQCGHWEPLVRDVAGAQMLALLRLHEDAAADWPARLQAGWARRRWSLAEFMRWADQALEGASFKPAHPAAEQVVILPLAQLLGRPFAAVVLPGCDEQRLNPSPEPPGFWTAAQRALLGLPAREALEAGLRAAWRQALLAPQVDVLWRAADEGGEPLQASPLVQALQLLAPEQATPAPEPRAERTLRAAPQLRSAPSAPQLRPARLSASAYDDLRDCPYRFFALRQLGLREAEELDAELDKRDFGQWLHLTLRLFHERLRDAPTADAAARLALLEQAAAEATRASALAEDEFLPFQAAWPRVRDGYLEWLAGHEAEGARFEAAEQSCEQALGPVTLAGRIDRIDRIDALPQADGVLLIDYKTEPLAVTRERVKAPLEDTQLPFYAALLPHDTLRAAYVNVGERGGTCSVEQHEVVPARDALIEGLLDDMRRIDAGAPMPALGEGQVCEYCAARGLCRKDFWGS